MSRESDSKLAQLLAVMQRLRDPQTGCPWDLEQDFRSIAPSTIEEAYEVVDAIENDDFEHLREELGDLLFQVVFYAQLADEQQRFNFDDIAAAITDKLLRRHPHVFPDGTLQSRVDPNNRPSEEFVTQQWETIKSQERRDKGKSGLLADIPTGLPAFYRAQKMQKRVAEVGFDWPDTTGVINKLQEELTELQQAVESGENNAIQDEIGDCFFTLVNLCRHLSVDAESCLRSANGKFSQRFQWLEHLAELQGKKLKELDAEQLESLWRQAKARTDA
jgi:ATP diphosphatase